jgi:hypothetical protein
MQGNRYTFGDNNLASVRLRKLADLYEPETIWLLRRSPVVRPCLACDLGCGPGGRRDHQELRRYYELVGQLQKQYGQGLRIGEVLQQHLAHAVNAPVTNLRILLAHAG